MEKLYHFRPLRDEAEVYLVGMIISYLCFFGTDKKRKKIIIAVYVWICSCFNFKEISMQGKGFFFHVVVWWNEIWLSSLIANYVSSNYYVFWLGFGLYNTVGLYTAKFVVRPDSTLQSLVSMTPMFVYGINISHASWVYSYYAEKSCLTVIISLHIITKEYKALPKVLICCLFYYMFCLLQHCAGINCLALLKSPELDGCDYLFTGSRDSTLKRWALGEDGASCSATFESHVDWV